MFLASKTEEQITNVNNLAKATGLDDLQILGKELTLLQASPKHAAVRGRFTAQGKGDTTVVLIV